MGETPRLYVGTYAKYNAGSIQGRWLDLDDFADADDFLAACRTLHADEEDPELMFQDFEGFPRTLYTESLEIDKIRVLYWFIGLEDYERELVEGYAEHCGTWPDSQDCTDFVGQAQDALFCILEDGSNDERDLGVYAIDEGLMGEVPKHLAGYINYEAIGRDLLMEMSLVTVNGQRMVFR